MMHITPGHRMVQRNLGRALNRLAPILVTANIVCWRVDAARLPTPHRVDTHGPITSSPAVPADALLRDRNAAYSDICGWEAGEDGGDPRAPLQCSSTTSFCALIRPDIIGCCDPQARRVGAPACEYFTTCYASTDVDEAIAKNTRVQRCTYTAPWIITTETSTFDRSASRLVTFTTTQVTTTTESECVKWVFEIDGTIGPSTYGCATSGTTIVVKTTISPDHMAAQITALYGLDTDTGASPLTGEAKIDSPAVTTATPSPGGNASPGLPFSPSPKTASPSQRSNASSGLPTPSSSTTSTPTGESGLSPWAIGGIAIGAVVAFVVVPLLAFLGGKYWRKRRSRRLPDTTVASPNPVPTPPPPPPTQEQESAVDPLSSQYWIPHYRL